MSRKGCILSNYFFVCFLPNTRMTITTSDGYSSNRVDKVWASSKASISQRTSLPFSGRMITLDCCHPGRNAWDMILFFLPHSTSASIATCVFTEYLIFYLTIQHYVAKNLILQHRTAWSFHEQHHLAVIVQQKMEDSLWNNNEWLVGKTKSSITSKSWKCEGPPYTM